MSDEQVAVTLASQLAVAYENASLLVQTRQALQRLSALRAIDLAILSSFDLRVTLNMLLDQVIPTGQKVRRSFSFFPGQKGCASTSPCRPRQGHTSQT